jgi:DNA-binding NtrC family response regulator
MKPLSILVADDEEAIRELLELWLKAAGHTATSVGSVTEAWAAMKERKFDLVITDILMPGGDGLDLIAGLKREQPAARILAISGGGHYVEGDDCLRMARGLGAHAVVMKPFSWEQLRAGITQALAPVSRAPW